MHNLGHYIIHETTMLRIVLELGTILDINNVGRDHRYLISPLTFGWDTDRWRGGSPLGRITMINGIELYGDLEPHHVSFCHGLGSFFTWELGPAPTQPGHTKASA